MQTPENTLKTLSIGTMKSWHFRRRGRLRPWFILLCGACLNGILADDWPRWLGPREDGSSLETGWLKEWPGEGPPLRFKKVIGTGYSAVVVAKGRLVLFHRLGGELVVSCLQADSGADGWEFRYPTDYVDRYGYSGGPRCSPVIDVDPSTGSGRVFTLGPKGVVHALDLATGKKIWGRDLQTEFGLAQNFFGVGAAPVVDGDRVILNLGGTEADSGRAFALSKADGSVLWKTGTGGGSYAAPRIAEIDGLSQLFIFHRTGMSCLDPATGRERWTFRWRSPIYDSVNAATPVVFEDVLFFSAAYRTGSAALRVKKNSYEVLWKDDPDSREKALESHWSNVNLVDGYLYGFSGRHESTSALSCVELMTGKVLWRWPGFLGRGSMLFADGHFIALGERGDLALLRLNSQGHEVLARVGKLLGHPSWTPPVLANGLLYLRDEEKLVCLDLRPRKVPATTGGEE